MQPLFSGVGVALVTIFDQNANIDAKATAALAQQLVGLGVSGIVLAGTNGEAASLQADERTLLVGRVRDSVPANVPVIAGVGAPTGKQAAVLTASAIDAGADGLLVLSPPQVGDPRRYYETVVSVAGDIPTLAYHYPAVSPPGLTVPTLCALPVVGVKDSSGDPERLLREAAEFSGSVYVGADTLLLMAGRIGVDGAILALANTHPEKCISAFQGDTDAQLSLLGPRQQFRADFPTSLKQMVAQRWGMSAVTRIGT